MIRATLAVALALLAGAPGSALAGEARVVSKQPSFTASAGEANRLTIARTGSKTFTLEDLGAPITPGMGCTAISASKARCTAPGNRPGDPGIVTLGDGDDSATTQGRRVPVSVRGGAGDDRLTANSTSSPFLSGGPGDDILIGGDLADFIFGEEGDDRLEGRRGGDQLSGGPGTDTTAGGKGVDTATYFQELPRTIPITVTLDGAANDGAPGENDDVASDVENVEGATGADVLIGDGDANRLTLGFTVVGALQGGRVEGAGGGDVVAGGNGPDVVDGGEGDDQLRDGDLNGATSTLTAGAGDDLLHAEDVADEDGATPELELAPTADVISCGSGRDQAYVDSADPRPEDCEVFTVRTPTLATTSGTGAKDVILGVQGDGGDDRINARGGNDRASGLGGDDRITGGAGRDKLSGGDGDDDIRARDGQRDLVRCGAGRDVVTADRDDGVARDCERVGLPSGGSLTG